jgi:hypothetical protein
MNTYEHYVLVRSAALPEIEVNYRPLATVPLRRDTALLRMRNVSDALCAKMIANDAVIGLDRIAQRDDETVTAIVYTDPRMDRQPDRGSRTASSTGPLGKPLGSPMRHERREKPNVPAYCKNFAKTLGGGTIIFHQDHNAYDGALSRITLPLKWLFRRQWRQNAPGTWRPYDLPWNSFFAVLFEREPALTMLLACLGTELQLHDIAHVRVGTIEQWFAAYDRLRPAGGYTGNRANQDALFAAIDKVAV